MARLVAKPSLIGLRNDCRPGIRAARPQKVIVAIGGGEIRTRGTASIDRETIRLSNKKNPKLLFIPTASLDSERYCRRVQEYFVKFLKCRTDILLLIKEQPSKEQVRKKILSADIIYVGGGNTLQMMRVWRRLGVDKPIKAAYENGTVLSGISAGSICWFDSGHSDSMSFYNPRKWKYTNVPGLGLIRGIHCPHYNSKTRGIPRRKEFRDMIRKIGGIGIAIENNCAIEFIDGRFTRSSARRTTRALTRYTNVEARWLQNKYVSRNSSLPSRCWLVDSAPYN